MPAPCEDCRSHVTHIAGLRRKLDDAMRRHQTGRANDLVDAILDAERRYSAHKVITH